jgi:hypothetical protein
LCAVLLAPVEIAVLLEGRDGHPVEGEHREGREGQDDEAVAENLQRAAETRRILEHVGAP